MQNNFMTLYELHERSKNFGDVVNLGKIEKKIIKSGQSKFLVQPVVEFYRTEYAFGYVHDKAAYGIAIVGECGEVFWNKVLQNVHYHLHQEYKGIKGADEFYGKKIESISLIIAERLGEKLKPLSIYAGQIATL